MFFASAFSSIQKLFHRCLKICSYPSILILLLPGIQCQPYESQTWKINRAEIHLQDFPFDKQTLALVGNWEFRSQHWLVPGSPLEDSFRNIEENWDSVSDEIGKELGYASYRVWVHLPPKMGFSDQYALYIPVVFSAYRLYIDGNLVAQNGTISYQKKGSSPSFHTRVIPLPRAGDKVEIIFHVSNFHHAKTGFLDPPKIGNLELIYREYNLIQTISWLLVILLFFLFLYHYAVFWINRTEAVSIYLSYIYLGILLMAANSIYTPIFFNLSPDWMSLYLIRLEHIGYAISIFGGAQVVFSDHSNIFNKRMLLLTKVYSVFLFVMAIFLSAKSYEIFSPMLFSLTTVIFFIACFRLGKSSLREPKQNLFYILSLILALFGIVLESFLFFKDSKIPFHFGWITVSLFIFPQTMSVTYRLVELFRSTQNISKELFKKKESLEKKVKTRTTELENANRWKANFVSLISHDLRSPLNSVNQILDLLEFQFDSLTKEEKKRFIAISKSGVKQSISMLEQLLDVSRFDALGTKLFHTRFPIYELLNEVIESVEPMALLKDIQIQKENFSNVEVVADRTLIGEVFKNILTNSLKYSYPKSTITIVVAFKGKWLTIEIRDQGIGMSEEQISKISEDSPIKSLPGTAGERGTGLGLKLTNAILEAHYGKLRIKSKLGEGSVFEVSLTKSTKTALLVDDSDSFRISLAEVLRRNQWIVVEAQNGEEALTHLSRILPDLIITDLHMPNMNGLSFIHEWEGRRSEAKVPIVLISSDAPLSGGHHFLEEEGISDLVNAYISKMYKPEDLYQKIEESLS